MSLSTSTFFTKLTLSTSSNLNGNTILSSIWSLIWGFIQGIMGAIVGAAQNIIYAMGSAFQEILYSWASSVAGYGVWSFLIGGISLVLTFFVIYFVMDFVGIEKDVFGIEGAL